ncbi:DUF814 domain-containing protein [Candidatus Woesearchaeota archaeon]|nr:MAG: DUF814 domain-containing protein [Candidatus Woesearchaeota archaeon]
MKVVMDLSKTIEENANQYFEKAKKDKKKLEGLRKAYKNTIQKIEKLKIEDVPEQPEQKKSKRKKEWYEKFRWFVSSDKVLVIGGRDATTNDIIIKKKSLPQEIVFHTDIRGSPFFVVKAENPPQNTINEAYEACASFSRAWNLGVVATEVYYVKREQVKVEMGLPKGTFMIYGKRNYKTTEIKLAIGLYEDKVMCGPVDSVKANCEHVFMLKPGKEKKSDVAKKLRQYYAKECGVVIDIEDILSVLPPGDCDIEEL